MPIDAPAPQFVDLLDERRTSSDILWVLKDVTKVPRWSGAREVKTSPEDFRLKVLNSPSIKHIITHISESSEDGRSEADLYEEARAILAEMGHELTLKMVRSFGFVLNKIFKTLYRHVYVNKDGIDRLECVIKQMPLVILPSHRSYLDFLLASYVFYNYGLPVPVIMAAQDFLGMQFIATVLRKCGAFFIKRSFKSDLLYWAIFTEYLQLNLRTGDTPVEFFIEGTRSRTNKFLYPRLGGVQTVFEAYLKGIVPDVALLPMSISYQRIAEENLYAREIGTGRPKPKESTRGVLDARSILAEDFGSIYITLGGPINFTGNLLVPEHLSLAHQARLLSLDVSLDKSSNYSVVTAGSLVHTADSILESWWQPPAPPPMEQVGLNGGSTSSTQFNKYEAFRRSEFCLQPRCLPFPGDSRVEKFSQGVCFSVISSLQQGMVIQLSWVLASLLLHTDTPLHLPSLLGKANELKLFLSQLSPEAMFSRDFAETSGAPGSVVGAMLASLGAPLSPNHMVAVDSLWVQRPGKGSCVKERQCASDKERRVALIETSGLAAVKLLMYQNGLSHLLAPLSLVCVSIATHPGALETVTRRTYLFLRALFSYEFVASPEETSLVYERSLTQLIRTGVVTSSLLPTASSEEESSTPPSATLRLDASSPRLNYLLSIIRPHLCVYSLLCAHLLTSEEPIQDTKALFIQVQEDVAAAILSSVDSSALPLPPIEALSLDIPKCGWQALRALGCVVRRGQDEGLWPGLDKLRSLKAKLDVYLKAIHSGMFTTKDQLFQSKL